MTSCVDSLSERPAVQREGSGFNPTSTLQKSDWIVIPIPRKEAARFIERHHYARGASNTAVFTHGLMRVAEIGKPEIYGVAWWLPPTKGAAMTVNLDHWRDVLALSRLACSPEAPKNSESFLLAHSVRMIRSVGRWKSLVTYADESQGHTGTIYRAAGWTYIGTTTPEPRWIDSATGRQVARLATETRTNAEMKALGYVVQGKFSKRKFVKHL